MSVSVAADGQSVDVSIPKDPSRQSFSFRYKVNNGTAPEKSEAMRGHRRRTGEHPPRLRPGPAKLANTSYPVNQGKLLPVR